MKRIDFENHFYDISVINALQERKEYPYYRKELDIINWSEIVDMPQDILLPKLLDLGDKRIKLMDELKIDTAVISCSPGVEQLDKEISIHVCKKTNDALYSISQRYPGRYIGSAVLPVKDVDAACEELERCVQKLGFAAWHTHSNYGTDAGSPDELKYRKIFKKASELGVYVYLHPQLPNFERINDLGFTFAGPGLGFTIDTVITILRMIATGLFDEIPNLTVILGHLGEGIPFLLDRIDNRINFLPNKNLSNKHLPSYYFKNNIMVTTSGNMSIEAFNCTKEVLGIDRILFGSDYPFENPHDMVHFIDSLYITDEEREMMYCKNAEKLKVFK